LIIATLSCPGEVIVELHASIGDNGLPKLSIKDTVVKLERSVLGTKPEPKATSIKLEQLA